MIDTTAIYFTVHCNATNIVHGSYGGNFAEYKFWESYTKSQNKRNKALGLNSHHYINIGF